VVSLLHLAAHTFAIFAVLAQQVRKRRILAMGAALVAAGLFFTTARHEVTGVQRSIASPPIWDADCFWIYGRVVLLFHAPYDTNAMHQAAKILPYDPDLTREVLDVGFAYPPPTVALVAPLGLFRTPRAAAPYWYGMLIAALVGQIILLWRHFLRADRWFGLAAAAMITAFLPLTSAVLTMGQTVFLAEVLLLLYLSARRTDESQQGLWLALATIVKPFLALVLLYPIVLGRWRVVLWSAATVAMVTMLVLPLIGWASVAEYVTRPPTSRWGAYMAIIDANQSLLAWVLRMEHRSPPFTAALHDPLYIGLTIALIALTLWRIRNVPGDRDYAATLLVIVAVAIYPAPGWYYGSMLSVPICLLWSRRDRIKNGSILSSAFTAGMFLLAAMENGQFVALIVAWAVMYALPTLEHTAHFYSAAQL
jgi:Glycosyltransferase family 87